MVKHLLKPPEDLKVEIYNASKLLYKTENNIPKYVKTVIQFCVNYEIGYIISRNNYAGNCREARERRYRLGHIGIPLYDELKSIVGKSKDSNGNELFIAMHCRAHMEIDFSTVKSMLNLSEDIVILSDEELKCKFDLVFGTVNPILLQSNANCNIVQVFDKNITIPISKYPGTMMTNAGDHTWGIEFEPKELIKHINNKFIGEISILDRELQTQDLPRSTNPKSIGIITGNGPDSGISLWKSINNYIVEIFGEHFLGDMSLPEVHIISAPAMGLSMELGNREEATWEVLSKAVQELKNQNIEILALACHTTHYFEKKIRDLFDSETQRFISMPEVVINYIENSNVNNLAILGINYVADLGKWSAYSKLSRFEVENINNDIMLKFNELGYDVKKMTNLHKSFQRLIYLIKNDIKSENIIIALTELSILLESNGKKTHLSNKNIIDALDLYAKEIAKLSLGL